MSGSESAIAAGTVLDGRYRLDTLIGRGGTAQVYRATDQVLAREVAVKVFDSRLTDLNTVERQRSEMHVLASLNHPNLVAVHDGRIAERDRPADASGHTYLVMELVIGVTLAGLLHDGPLPPERTRQIGLTLAGALAYVHAHDLVHRDVKPANVLLSESGLIKLGDFGLARLLTAEDRVTTGSDVMGTAAYFSPEQASAREVGPAADVYSLGLVLLECLTGRREFPGEAVPSAVARLLRNPIVPPDLPAPWPALLTSMTGAMPLGRPTAAQVVQALAVPSIDHTGPMPSAALPALASDLATDAWSTPLSPFLMTPTPSDRRSRRRGPVLLGAGGLLTAVVVAGAMMIGQTGASPSPSAPTTSATSSSSAPLRPTTSAAPVAPIVRASRLASAVRTTSAPTRTATSEKPAPTSAVTTPRSSTPATTSVVPVVVLATRTVVTTAAPPAPAPVVTKPGPSIPPTPSAVTPPASKTKGAPKPAKKPKPSKKPKG